MKSGDVHRIFKVSGGTARALHFHGIFGQMNGGSAGVPRIIIAIYPQAEVRYARYF